LKLNEECPADILIIECKENFCLIDTKSMNGKYEYSLKLPIRSTFGNIRLN